MNLEYVLHQVRTEIKIDSEGRGSCSIRGTARLAGISDGSLGITLKTGALLEPSRLARFLISQGFEGALLENWAETGIPDMAVAAILEYYAFEAGKYVNQQSQLVYRAFSRIGVRAWMQDITGYQKPRDSEIDIREFLLQQLPENPKKWERRFKPEFWAALERLYGLTRDKKACSMFIAHWVYGYFPKEVMERINEVNPTDGGLNRERKIHQHFNDVLLKALEMQISIVTSNLIKAENKHHFKRLMKNARRYRFTVSNLKSLQGV